MGKTKFRNRVKTIFLNAGQDVVEYIRGNLIAKKGWRGDSAPSNSPATFNKKKYIHGVATDYWMMDTGRTNENNSFLNNGFYPHVSQHGNKGDGWTMSIRLKKTKHFSFRGKKNRTSYEKIWNRYGHGNPMGKHPGAGVYSGAIPPKVPEDIQANMTKEIKVALVEELGDVMDTALKGLLV